MSTSSVRRNPTSDAIEGPRPPTRSVTWSVDAPYLTSRASRTALCRETADGWVLQHVRTVTVSQRAASECTIDTAPALEDLPAHVRAKLPEDLEVSDRA